MKIRVVLTGRSYHTAASLPAELELPAGASLNDALNQINAVLTAESALPDSCLIAIGGQHVGTVANHPDVELQDGQELVLIAPVAGG